MTGPARFLGIWAQAARPRTLSLSAMPVIAAGALAWTRTDDFAWPVLLIALICAAAIQIGTNLHNDAADFINGTDTGQRAGPARVTQSGLATPAQVVAMAHGAFATAVLCGLYLIWVGGWPFAALGLAALAAGYGYSGGPWPVSRTPLGEVFVLVFFGLVAVGGTSYLLIGHLTPATLLLGTAIGLQAAAVLLLNNHRDRQTDARAGRRTLAILIGPAASKVLHAGLMAASLPLGLLVNPAPAGWLILLAAPLGLAANRCLARGDGAALNPCLGQTALFQVVFTLSFVLGLVLGEKPL